METYEIVATSNMTPKKDPGQEPREEIDTLKEYNHQKKQVVDAAASKRIETVSQELVINEQKISRLSVVFN